MQSTENNIIIYQSQDGKIKVDVRFENETVWLSIDQMAVLFGKSRSTINEHILNIYTEGNLRKSIQKEKSEIPTFLQNPLTSTILMSSIL